MDELRLGTVRWPLTGDRRERALGLLTAAESSRLDGDRSPERFLAGRMLLRELAAELTGGDPASITVTAPCPDCEREHGQPRIDGLFVSLSHADDLVVAAVSASHPVGVDVEARDASPERLAAIRPVAGGDDLEHWTRVEAVLKADGRGLRLDPGAVRIRGELATLDGVDYALSRVDVDADVDGDANVDVSGFVVSVAVRA